MPGRPLPSCDDPQLRMLPNVQYTWLSSGSTAGCIQGAAPAVSAQLLPVAGLGGPHVAPAAWVTPLTSVTTRPVSAAPKKYHTSAPLLERTAKPALRPASLVPM